MSHTIIIRPTADFEPTVGGLVKHSIQVAEGVEIITESTDYLRAMARVLNERADKYADAEPELQHPGTWLPGDRLTDPKENLWERGSEGKWPAPKGMEFGYLTDSNVDWLVKIGELTITHLVPRSEVA